MTDTCKHAWGKLVWMISLCVSVSLSLSVCVSLFLSVSVSLNEGQETKIESALKAKLNFKVN